MNRYHLSKISQSVVGINNLGNLVSGDVIGKTKNVLDHTLLKIKTLEKIVDLPIKLKALGAYIAPNEHPIITWNIRLEE